MHNNELRNYCRNKGVRLYEICWMLGISEPTLSRRLRKELQTDELKKYMAVVDEIVKEREAEGISL